ncbi:hypothetical protein BDV35DRAFT_340603, partial [Aspergillus flavus]
MLCLWSASFAVASRPPSLLVSFRKVPHGCQRHSPEQRGLYTNLNPFSPSFVLARLFLPVGSSYPSSFFLSSFLFFVF